MAKGNTGVLDQVAGKTTTAVVAKETVADLNIRIDTVLDMQASGPKSAVIADAVWSGFNEGSTTKIDEVTESFRQSLMNTVAAAKTLAGTHSDINRKFGGRPRNGEAIVEALLGVGGQVAKEVKADRKSRKTGASSGTA